MRTSDQILDLLPRLDQSVADDLEDQDLDFKEWNTRSMDDSVKLVIEMAVCMANGGGGTVVFGVNPSSAVWRKNRLISALDGPRRPLVSGVFSREGHVVEKSLLFCGFS